MRSDSFGPHLLHVVASTALEPGYARAAARQPAHAARNPLPTIVVLLVAGLLLGGASANSAQGIPVVAKERAQLVEQVKQANVRNEELGTRAADLRQSVSDLRAKQLSRSEDARLTAMEVATGSIPVVGPGVVVEVDDAVGSELGDAKGRLLDLDLRQIVNGLWAAGAEAITINGHRIGPETAIRGAGQAITVNYRSLLRPYRVEAVGDPGQLPARFEESSGGKWLRYLMDYYAIPATVTSAERLELAPIVTRSRHAAKKEV